MKTMCPLGYYPSDLVVTHALGHMLYMIDLTQHHVLMCIIHELHFVAIVVVTRRAYCFHDYILYIYICKYIYMYCIDMSAYIYIYIYIYIYSVYIYICYTNAILGGLDFHRVFSVKVNKRKKSYTKYLTETSFK